MEPRELQFWVVEAMRTNDLREASMADAVRYAQHADADAYGRYVRGLRERPELQRQESEQTIRDKWKRLQEIGRG
jgi:hypothetical protein